MISFEPTESEPEEFCSAGIEKNPVVVRDENTIVFGDGRTDYAHGVLRRWRQDSSRWLQRSFYSRNHRLRGGACCEPERWRRP